jgi:propanol-preferring alcohol dehydrogenase
VLHLLEVAAIGRGADKAELARKLGAHHYIDSSSIDPGQALQKLGGAALVIVSLRRQGRGANRKP